MDKIERQQRIEALIGCPADIPASEPDACDNCLSVAYNEKGIIHFFDCPKHGDNPPHVTFSGHER